MMQELQLQDLDKHSLGQDVFQSELIQKIKGSELSAPVRKQGNQNRKTGKLSLRPTFSAKRQLSSR